jgi:ankyrin repeat protein
MTRVTPQLMVDLIKTFPQEERGKVQADLTALMRPPYPDLNCKLKCQALPVTVGLLEYALRFGTAETVSLLLEAGIDPNAGAIRPMTVLCMAQACGDTGRIEKLEALLQAGAQADYFEIGPLVPPTPLIALARAKATGIQRYWMARLLRAAGATAHTANDYELRVVARLLGELRAIDGIMEELNAADREATKTTPSSFEALVQVVLRGRYTAALRRMVIVKKELRLALDFDPTAELLALTHEIADQPITPHQAEFARALIKAGAVFQLDIVADSAFERALNFENHELTEIFLEAGAKPDLASDPNLVAELMRRQGLPQLPLRRPAEAFTGPPNRALATLDLLCSSIEALEACPEADLGRLNADQSAAMHALAERLAALADRLTPSRERRPAAE